MYTYKVEIYESTKEAETNMNKWAKSGWKVIAVCPGVQYGLIVTFQK